MAFVPAAAVVFVVKEREIGAKHLQLISGVCDVCVCDVCVCVCLRPRSYH